MLDKNDLPPIERMRAIQKRKGNHLPASSPFLLPFEIWHSIRDIDQRFDTLQQNAKIVTQVIKRMFWNLTVLSKQRQGFTQDISPINFKPNEYQLLNKLNAMIQQDARPGADAATTDFINKVKPCCAFSFDQLVAAASAGYILSRGALLRYYGETSPANLLFDQSFYNLDVNDANVGGVYGILGNNQNFGVATVVLSRDTLIDSHCVIALKPFINIDDVTKDSMVLGNMLDPLTLKVLSAYIAALYPNGLTDYLTSENDVKIEVRLADSIPMSDVDLIILPTQDLADLFIKTFPKYKEKVQVGESSTLYLQHIKAQIGG